jgi:phospholipid transport system substrate-binding protein
MLARHILHTTAAVLLVAATLCSGTARSEELAQGAERFIAELADRASAVLTDDSMSTGERQQRFREMFRESFDVPEVARFVLGRYWRRVGPQQREEYLRLFEEFVVQTWAPRFAEYDRKRFSIRAARDDPGGITLVSSVLSLGESDPIRVDWQVGRPASTYKIVDIVVEGISMRITQRSEFTSVIRRGKGEIEALLEALRKKTAALQVEPQ